MHLCSFVGEALHTIDPESERDRELSISLSVYEFWLHKLMNSHLSVYRL